MGADVFLGTQGWSYPAWVGPFYPVGTPPAEMLRVYSRAFRSVEVDSTFYGVPAEPVVREWRNRVPPKFVFALKVPQDVTHSRQLVDVEEILSQFLRRVELLEDQLGPLLVQLSPAFRPSQDNHATLRDFVLGLPRGFRWVIEFRDPRWASPAVVEQLRAKNVALALVDGRWIRRRVMLDLASQPTADFAYVRWMGQSRKITDYSHVQIDRDRELSMWAAALGALSARVTTIFGYFNNHFQGHSPHSVREFQRMVGQKPVEPTSLREQAELFS